MRLAARSVGAVGVVGLLTAGGLVGQAPADASRGWLGIGVQELVECRAERGSRGRCAELAKRLVVSRVVVGGPADRAGLQLGDTILALNGRRLDGGLAEPAFASLRPAAPVQVRVGREEGRRALTVVPDRRPGGRVTVRVATPAGPQVVRTSLAATAPRAPGPAPRVPLVLRVREGGVYQIHPRVAIVVQGAEEDGRYVLLEPGPELRALQDSVFRNARQRLDSLRRAFAGFEARLADREARRADRGARADGAFARMPSVEAGLPPLVWNAGFGRSVAGAEFEALSPELAAFFEGAEEGLLCLRVVSGTPADRLGLRPGDVVVEVGGRPVAGIDDLRAAIRRGGGRPLGIRWIRKGRPMEGALGEP